MNPWLQVSASTTPRARLVCVPRAGGTAADFTSWGSKLGDEIEVCAVQLPGRHRRFAEPAVRTTAPIVTRVAAAIQELQELPLLLFGDCMGAILAYEIARQLRRAGAPLPRSLIVSAYPAPHHKRTTPNFHDSPIGDFRQRLLDVGGIPQEMQDDEELFSLLLPTLRADFELFETYEYVPELPVDIDIYAIIGQADPHVPFSLLDGWRRHTNRSFEKRCFAGGHFFLRENADVLEFVREVARRNRGTQEDAQ